jgi:hypothetical protein
MSAHVDAMFGATFAGSAASKVDPAEVNVPWEEEWNPEDYAHEQIRGLVRRVFLSNTPDSPRQVVFSASDVNTEVGSICDQVGRALALETSADIAIVGRELWADSAGQTTSCSMATAIKSCARQEAVNLWHVSEFDLRKFGQEPGTAQYWVHCLDKLRNEFQYTIIQAPAAATSSEAALLGQLADGIILVLGAHRTRRASARKIKETLQAAHSRILGTVLNGRRFPVPASIYRRL